MATTNTEDGHWVGTWATAPVGVEGLSINDQTVRGVSHLSIGGSTLRVRISNAFGTGDLQVGAAHIGRRAEGANVASGSGRPLTFGGSPAITIPAGALAVSDPVDLDVPALTDVSVSVYLPGDLSGGFPVTGHDPAHQTNYISSRGDFSSVEDFPVDQEVEAFMFVTGVEVLAPPETGAIVALGDSLTEGNLSALDANRRWPDQLARRTAKRERGRRLGVVNLGIGGGRLLHDGHGDSGMRRFDRDVLGQPGATHLIVSLGVNDLRNSYGQLASEIVSAEQLIAGLHQLAVRAHAAGLIAYAGTVMPFEHETFHGGFWTPEGDDKRHAVNAWLRETSEFDGIVDFDAALRDPSHRTALRADWDSGDHLHPNDTGYTQMGDSVPLELFD